MTNQSGSGGQTVFVVEDDPDSRRVIGEILEEEGFRALLCTGAEDALVRLVESGELPAAVIVDLMMPGMSGAELAGTLLGDARWRHVRVVVFTAWHDTTAPSRLNIPIVQKPDMVALIDAIKGAVGPPLSARFPRSNGRARALTVAAAAID